MFRAGDKVVCVDDSFDAETASYFSPLPVHGAIYCIRAVGTDVVNGKLVVWVVGISGRQYIGHRERPLKASRFRKLQSGDNAIKFETDYGTEPASEMIVASYAVIGGSTGFFPSST